MSSEDQEQKTMFYDQLIAVPQNLKWWWTFTLNVHSMLDSGKLEYRVDDQCLNSMVNKPPFYMIVSPGPLSSNTFRSIDVLPTITEAVLRYLAKHPNLPMEPNILSEITMYHNYTSNVVAVSFTFSGRKMIAKIIGCSGGNIQFHLILDSQ